MFFTSDTWILAGDFNQVLHDSFVAERLTSVGPGSPVGKRKKDKAGLMSFGRIVKTVTKKAVRTLRPQGLRWVVGRNGGEDARTSKRLAFFLPKKETRKAVRTLEPLGGSGWLCWLGFRLRLRLPLGFSKPPRAHRAALSHGLNQSLPTYLPCYETMSYPNICLLGDLDRVLGGHTGSVSFTCPSLLAYLFEWELWVTYVWQVVAAFFFPVHDPLVCRWQTGANG